MTDITYIRTWQGWLYLAAVLDRHSRTVVGWSMKPKIAKVLVLDALMMAVWRRKPMQEVIVHSDQSSQYGSDNWKRFCYANKLLPSMSCRGNCWANAVAESFFSSLKKERIRKRIYKKHRSFLQSDKTSQSSGWRHSRGIRTHLNLKLEFVYRCEGSPSLNTMPPCCVASAVSVAQSSQEK